MDNFHFHFDNFDNFIYEHSLAIALTILFTLLCLNRWYGFELMTIESDDYNDGSSPNSDCDDPACVRCNLYKETLTVALQTLPLIPDRSIAEKIHYGIINCSYRYSRLLGQQPTVFHYRGLDSNPFLETEQIGDCRRLEDGFDVIKSEYDKISQVDRLGVWKVNRTPTGAWDVFHLIDQGVVSENAKLCPRTMNIIHSLNSVMDKNVFGNAMFSVIKPGTLIQEHYGPSNVRLRCHLGLHVTPHCILSVGDQQSSWQNGRCLLFDDSFLHSVAHFSDPDDQTRKSKSSHSLTGDTSIEAGGNINFSAGGDSSSDRTAENRISSQDAGRLRRRGFVQVREKTEAPTEDPSDSHGFLISDSDVTMENQEAIPPANEDRLSSNIAVSERLGRDVTGKGHSERQSMPNRFNENIDAVASGDVKNVKDRFSLTVPIRDHKDQSGNSKSYNIQEESIDTSARSKNQIKDKGATGKSNLEHPGINLAMGHDMKDAATNAMGPDVKDATNIAKESKNQDKTGKDKEQQEHPRRFMDLASFMKDSLNKDHVTFPRQHISIGTGNANIAAGLGPNLRTKDKEAAAGISLGDHYSSSCTTFPTGRMVQKAHKPKHTSRHIPTGGTDGNRDIIQEGCSRTKVAREGKNNEASGQSSLHYSSRNITTKHMADEDSSDEGEFEFPNRDSRNIRKRSTSKGKLEQASCSKIQGACGTEYADSLGNREGYRGNGKLKQATGSNMQGACGTVDREGYRGKGKHEQPMDSKIQGACGTEDSDSHGNRAGYRGKGKLKQATGSKIQGAFGTEVSDSVGNRAGYRGKGKLKHPTGSKIQGACGTEYSDSVGNRAGYHGKGSLELPSCSQMNRGTEDIRGGKKSFSGKSQLEPQFYYACDSDDGDCVPNLDRAVLIVDLWHPQLSTAERNAIDVCFAPWWTDGASTPVFQEED